MCAKNCVLPPLPSLVPSLSTPAARISLIPNRCRVMTLARLPLLSSVPFYVRQISCKKLRDTEDSTGASVSFSQLSACRALIFVCYIYFDTCTSVQVCSCKEIASLIVPLFLECNERRASRPRRIHGGHASFPSPPRRKKLAARTGGDRVSSPPPPVYTRVINALNVDPARF